MSHETRLLNKQYLLRRYAEERDRRQRFKGLDQYIRATRTNENSTDVFSSSCLQREPIVRDAEVAIVGGGIAGLISAIELVRRGFEPPTIIDRAPDFGGTWFWNRYPGVRCDTSSLVYLPYLEETGYFPSAVFVPGSEILEHCRRLARYYGLYRNAVFGRSVSGLVWDESTSHWILRTDKKDQICSRFVGLGIGELHIAKIPNVDVSPAFTGRLFHASQWDYDATGGSPDAPRLDRLVDKRVALIGTGPTAVQCLPHLAETAKRLFVFQRTPASIYPQLNRSLHMGELQKSLGWQSKLRTCFHKIRDGDCDQTDSIRDGWTRIAAERCDYLSLGISDEDVDLLQMEQVRDRVRREVHDSATAEALLPWYGQYCKRPCFSDSYLAAFNRPTVSLIDTGGAGISAIDSQGIVALGNTYPVDIVIFASGFESATPYVERAGFDPIGRGKRRLSDHWQSGMRSLHGAFVANFPNMFIVQPSQSSNLYSNLSHNFLATATSVASLLLHMRDASKKTFTPTDAAEDAWVLTLMEGTQSLSNENCTPGRFNAEGQNGRSAKLATVGYPKGSGAFFDYLSSWCEAGDFPGLQID